MRETVLERMGGVGSTEMFRGGCFEHGSYCIEVIHKSDLSKAKKLCSPETNFEIFLKDSEVISVAKPYVFKEKDSKHYFYVYNRSGDICLNRDWSNLSTDDLKKFKFTPEQIHFFKCVVLQNCQFSLYHEKSGSGSQPSYYFVAHCVSLADGGDAEKGKMLFQLSGLDGNYERARSFCEEIRNKKIARLFVCVLSSLFLEKLPPLKKIDQIVFKRFKQLFHIGSIGLAMHYAAQGVNFERLRRQGLLNSSLG